MLRRSRRCALFAVLLLALPSPAIQANLVTAADAPALYEDAVQRFNRGDVGGAVIQLKNVLQADPANLPARLLLARAHLAEGEAGAAEKELLRAREMGADPPLVAVPLARAYSRQGKHEALLARIQPGDHDGTVRGELHLLRGQAHLARGELDAAEAALGAAGDLLEDRAPVLLGLAGVRMRQGDLEGAEGLLEEARALAPGSAEIWYQYGEVRRRQGEVEAGIDAYAQAVERNPRHFLARNARAALLVDLGRLEEAAAEVAHVRERDDLDPQAAYLDYLIRIQQGDRQAAAAALEDAVRILTALPAEYVESHPPSFRLAGIVHFAAGNLDQAQHWLGAYVEAHPASVHPRKLLGAIHLQRNEARDAVRVLEPALKVAPDDMPLQVLVARAYLETGRNLEARELLARVAAAAPEGVAVRSQLAWSRLRLGERDAAIADLEAVYRLDPGQTGIGLMLGRTYLAQGRNADAARIAAGLVAREPDNPSHHNLAAAAAAGQGDMEAAKRAFAAALQADPGFAPAALNLARLELRDGQVDAAETRYEGLLTANRDEVRALEGLADVALARGEAGSAIEWLEKARAKNAAYLGPQLRLADLYLRTGQPERAAALAAELEAVQPKHLGVLEAVGRAELATGKTDRAVATFKRMSKEAFYSPDILARVAGLQLEAGDATGAYWSLIKAADARPEDVAIQRALVEVELRLDKMDAALERAAALHRKYPDAALGPALTGDVLMRGGAYGEAAEAYRAALERSPETGLAVRLHRALEAAGRDAEAVDALGGWVGRNPDDLAARTLLASAYRRAGRTAHAVSAYEAVLAARPDDPAVLNNLALLYQETGDSRARELAERAHAQAPDSAAVLDTLGSILVAEGEPAAGLKYLREAHSRASREPSVRYHLALALSRLGRESEARALLEALVAEGGGLPRMPEAEALLRSLEGRVSPAARRADGD